MSQLHPIQTGARTCGLRRGRRRGVALVYTAFGMIALLGAGALTTDMGILYIRRSQAQRTADAAALAGAYHLANVKGTQEVKEQQASAWARYYAKLAKNGGYEEGVNGAKVSVIIAPTEKNVVKNNWIEVQISRPEPLFFGFFKSQNQVVFAKATAMYETKADFKIKGIGTYGVAPGPVNLAVFGPLAQYNNGDYLSSRFMPDGVTLNSANKNFEGYEFKINVPLDAQDTVVEIFDPDCYNVGGSADVGAPGPDGLPLRVDELRAPATGGPNQPTTTQYTLYADNGTPNNVADDRLVFDRSYGGISSDDIAADMKWNEAFGGNRRIFPTSQFRLIVKTTAGASENGFDLRVGPRRTGSQPFNPNNGATVTATGSLPINFNTSGKVKIALGTIPVEAAGGDLKIRKFDTDVGSKNITYSCDTLPNSAFKAGDLTGKLSGNGTFETDTIRVPASYTTAGTWYAEYEAGQQDTSVWDMWYSNAGPGKPGSIKLVR